MANKIESVRGRPARELNDAQIRERLNDYAVEFCELARTGASKDHLRNGWGNKHGLNHIIELFNMLPDGPGAEFRVRS